jgi:hypothetical protein
VWADSTNDAAKENPFIPRQLLLVNGHGEAGQIR